MPNCSDLMLKCWWQGSVVSCSEIFEIRQTDEGFCCSFNTLRQSENIDLWVQAVNFTNRLVQSTNARVHSIWCKRCHSLSPPKLCHYLLVFTTRSFAQLLFCMPYVYDICQKELHKSTGTKAAHKNVGEIDLGLFICTCNQNMPFSIQ